MTAKELYQAGRLKEAVQAAGAEVRNNPIDTRARTFLFELLAFAGEFDRADKHLEVLAQAGADAQLGAVLYRAALAAERTRQELFAKGEYPRGKPDAATAPPAATINGRRYESVEDADPRIGARLEVFAAGSYLWIPFEHIATVRMEPPRRLRDLLWAPALVATGPSFKGRELGEVLLPVIAPLSWKHSDDAVRLGRVTHWEEAGEGLTVPVGQKMLLADDEEIPWLEIRSLEFEAAAEAA
jgi:type VI secretion system protein ImpE